jgi:hypothetical protein
MASAEGRGAPCCASYWPLSCTKPPTSAMLYYTRRVNTGWGSAINWAFAPVCGILGNLYGVTRLRQGCVRWAAQDAQ